MTHASLIDRVVLVTGGSRGLGKVMAVELAKAGARLLIAARSADAIEDTVREIRSLKKGACEGFVGDLSQWEVCAAAVDAAERSFGPIQVLVNNAAVGFPTKQASLPPGTPFPFWTYAPEDIGNMVRTNLLGPFAMFHTVAPKMVAAGFGKVISISTSRATMRRPNAGAYGPIKAALEASTAIWSQELRDTGVTANVLLPGGPTDTAFVPGGNVGRRAKPFAAGKAPLGQEGTNTDLLPPAIMGPPILWLASDASNGVSGKRFVARDWDPDLEAGEAARRAMQQPSAMPVIM